MVYYHPETNRTVVFPRHREIKILIKCIDKIIEEGNSVLGLQKTCELLKLLKEGQNLTDISKALGASREQATSIAVLNIFQYTLQRGDKSERQ